MNLLLVILLRNFGDDRQSALHVRRFQPSAVGFGERAFFGRDLLDLAAGIECEQFRLNLITAQLARGGARKIVLPDVVGENSLGGRQRYGDAVHVIANDLANVHDLVLAQHFKIGNDDTVQPFAERLTGLATLQAEHAELLDPRGAQIITLNLFRIDVLAGTENDDVFSSSGNEVVALFIRVSEVTGVKPSVFQHFGSRFRTIVVSLHHRRTGQRDFANHVAVFVQFRIHQLGLQPRQRTPNRANHIVVWRRTEAAAGCLRHAERLQHLKAECVDVAANLRVETRAACNEISNIRSELRVNLLEQYLAEIEARLLRQRAHASHDTKDLLGKPALLRNLSEDALMDEVEELRNAAEDCNAPLPQRERQLLRV